MEKIDGSLVTYLFNNKNNGYSIAKIKTSTRYISVCGYFPMLQKDMKYSFFGEYFVHQKYGEGFKVMRVERIIDNSREGIVAYLSSDLFIGIGKKTAERIYDLLGENCLKIITNDIDSLNALGMSEIKKQTLYNALKSNQDIEKILVTLYKYGLTTKVSLDLYAKYESKTLEIIEENPYRLIDELENFGFDRADAIAKDYGILEDDERRIKACLIFILNNALYKQGFSYLTREQLLLGTSKYLGLDDYLITDSLEVLINEGEIVYTEDKYYIKVSYETERELEKRLRKFSTAKIDNHNEDDYEKALDFIKRNSNISYTDSQINIIKKALKSPFSVITGGPGTGKTTIINGIIKGYMYLKGFSEDTNKIWLVAPTGRAAKRMSEASDFTAQTIHRALGYTTDGNFLYGPYNLISASLVIVDESSMLDMFLAHQLLSAIRPNAQVILVGDANQLPSVGPGQVLKEIIESDLFDVFKLIDIHRQYAESPIIALANEVLEGEISQRVVLECKDKISNEVIKQIYYFLNKGYLLNDIQVLVPMYKGDGGINNLNVTIQEEFNHEKIGIKYGERGFKINDRVLQNTNNLNKKLMNGDVGVIKDIFDTNDGKFLKIDFDGLMVNYEKGDLDELTLAYALSVHKSQGSEYKVVILVILPEHYIMLKRKLIYTAITRAKEELVVIGSERAFLHGIKDNSYNRQTTLFSNKKLSEFTPYDFL